ncbi:hypothetical protein Hypma_013473 [Hypsizygus marmoreus]|uniref:F-box domain-containing protein n=1 Tax=Hypsizygus marmoreus TaxID=39966 RepID=A0A369JJC6_HYPMA|nr:hypothetical protein Hypma_013473 [Hypsizygus marmoreus]
MPLTTLLGSFLPNFLLSRFKRNSACYIFRLPLDTHVDQIFIYLHIEDILCLRRVNKAFFLLTHEPIIWKRFLANISIPLPPLRPTFRYALEATDFEIEQLVSRAISLDDNWRRPKPRITPAGVFPTHYHVLDLQLLPGGKYLLASVKDSSSTRFFIIVFCLDHPKGPHPLARLPTRSRAYHMQAKYMKFEGKHVIMVAYNIRAFEGGAPANVDPSEYNWRAEIDPPHSFHHELCVAYVNLHSLEAMTNPVIVPGEAEYTSIAQRQKGPFYQLATAVTGFRVDMVSLFEMGGKPFVSLVQLPRYVSVLQVDAKKNTTSSFRCEEVGHLTLPTLPNVIKALRALPGQNELLVIRTITVPSLTIKEGKYTNLLEIYDMPDNNEFDPVSPKARFYIGRDEVTRFHISDYGIPSKNGETIYTLRHDTHPPPPISIYAETTLLKHGTKHWLLWPGYKETPATRTKPATKTFHYDLEHVCEQSEDTCDTTHVPCILPGAYRALIYTVDHADRTDTPGILTLKRYVNPEVQPEGYPIPRVDRSTSVLRRDHPPVPEDKYTALELDAHVMQTYQRGGLGAIAWDEGSGRVCVATGNSENIEMWDFACVERTDMRFEQWKRNQEFVVHDRYDNETGALVVPPW